MERFVIPPPNGAACPRLCRSAKLGLSDRVLWAQLVHSKTTMGHGRCTTAEEVQKLIDQIQEVIDSK